MPRNPEGEPVFSIDCPNQGDYGLYQRWPVLRPRDFHVNGLQGAPEGMDEIGACFVRTKRDRGYVWVYSVDVGDTVQEDEGARIRALSQDQIQAVGGILCAGIAECPGAQVGPDGTPHCPAFNFDTFMEAVD